MIIVMIIIIIIVITTVVNHFPLFVLRLFFIFSFFGWSTASWKVTVKSSHLTIIIITTTTIITTINIIITFLKQLCLWIANTPTLKATPFSFFFAAPSLDQSAVARGGPPLSACPVVAVAAIACGRLAAAEAGTDRRLRLQRRLSLGQPWLTAAGLRSRSRQ